MLLVSSVLIYIASAAYYFTVEIIKSTRYITIIFMILLAHICTHYVYQFSLVCTSRVFPSVVADAGDITKYKVGD